MPERDAFHDADDYEVRHLPRLGQRYFVLNLLSTLTAIVAAIALFFRAGTRDETFWTLVIVFLAAVVGCILLDRVLIKSIRCPSCGQTLLRAKPPKGKIISIQYHCRRCRLVWDTAAPRGERYSEPLQ
jgi:phage FluMu protein Com